MSLNRIIAEVTEAHEADGIINRQAAINDAVPQILADEEMTEMCVRGHASRMIATNVRNRAREDRATDPRQTSIFGLRETYVLDDSEGQIKRTPALNREEFLSLIVVRQQQVNADIAHLTKLRNAERLTADIWNAHPDWTWGDVEREYDRRLPKAA